MVISDFRPLLKDIFRIQFSDQALELCLEEVTSTGDPYTEGARQPFSLLFSADASRGILRQGNYELNNDQFGKQNIFLVPVGVREGVCHYEAIYN